MTRLATRDGTVLHHILLDSLHGAEAVGSAGLLLVITLSLWVRRLTASRERRTGAELGHDRNSVGGARWKAQGASKYGLQVVPEPMSV